MTVPSALDVKEGDLLVVNGKEYPIRSVAEWPMSQASYASFARLATKTVSTKGSPGLVNGKRGAPVTLLSNLKCHPLTPVDAETQRRMVIDTPHEVKQTFLDSLSGFYHLIVEDLKV